MTKGPGFAQGYAETSPLPDFAQGYVGQAVVTLR